MQRNTGNTESITIEYGFLDSKGDDVNQLKNNWQRLAEAVVRAVTDYANIPYSKETNDNIYIVKSGDSLWGIAKKYGISVSDLKNLNDLTNNTLRIGQVLKIPQITDNIQAIEYTVKSGDTLYKIANNYNLSISELMKINNLSSNLLSVGQILKIPVENIQEEINTYIVNKGDTLYKIANKFNTTVDEIKKLNNLNNNILSVGQEIRIPNNQQLDYYVVKSGDTLYGIANKYNTTITYLKEKNNLSDDTLNIGQILYI